MVLVLRCKICLSFLHLGRRQHIGHTLMDLVSLHSGMEAIFEQKGIVVSLSVVAIFEQIGCTLLTVYSISTQAYSSHRVTTV